MQDRAGTIWMVTVVNGMYPTGPVCPEHLSLWGSTSSYTVSKNGLKRTVSKDGQKFNRGNRTDISAGFMTSLVGEELLHDPPWETKENKTGQRSCI